MGFFGREGTDSGDDTNVLGGGCGCGVGGGGGAGGFHDAGVFWLIAWEDVSINRAGQGKESVYSMDQQCNSSVDAMVWMCQEREVVHHEPARDANNRNRQPSKAWISPISRHSFQT